MKSLIKNPLFFIILTTSAFPAGAQNLTREQYIDKYSGWAVEEMLRSGIPASVTLAQGLLESDNGNSTLAMRGNNHFGIKCHGWKGRKITHDDDRRNECFRKYKSARESYTDHTDFLMNSPRYSFLFELEQTDYTGWARGLKKAGYATASNYASMLVNIIEENGLEQYDRGRRRPIRKPLESRLAESLRPDRLVHPLITGDEENVAPSLVRRLGGGWARRRRKRAANSNYDKCP